MKTLKFKLYQHKRMRTFFTCLDSTKIECSQFFKQSLNAIKKASRQDSKKLKCSSNRDEAAKNLVRRYENISNRRRDWFWKLAHQLTNKTGYAGYCCLIRECPPFKGGEYVNGYQFHYYICMQHNSLSYLLKIGCGIAHCFLLSKHLIPLRADAKVQIT